ncbi:MAG: HipA N-terminal domain-containing protein [Sphaerochaetaceae bacterium]|jgi:serine/threonine-protein kinase HipA
MAYRSAQVFIHNVLAGILKETDQGYTFSYNEEYLKSERAVSVSLTLPLRDQAYVSATMFPFFDGLIPEGWLLEIFLKNWKLDAKDRMGLLLVACTDTIGSVTLKRLT